MSPTKFQGLPGNGQEKDFTISEKVVSLFVIPKYWEE
jgi:hypothetical protein